MAPLAAADLPIPAQLGLLVPFLFALWWVFRWVFGKLDESLKAKDVLYERILKDIVPLLGEVSTAIPELIAAAREIRMERDKERERAIRLEERLRSQSRREP